jgi:tetratricopeptide (TPR) repeat protein
MHGTFKQGLALIPHIQEKLENYSLFIDRHRILVLNYKIAMLYFGSGDYNTSIDYLQRIINDKTDLRYDLQCYARLLHMLAHYELGNDMLMESLSKSVYRFMAKMQNLTTIEEAMIKFLRQSLPLSPRQLKPEFEKFLKTIKHLEKNRFDTRAFAYLDVISWIESKVYDRPMSQIIHDKYLESKRRK